MSKSSKDKAIILLQRINYIELTLFLFTYPARGLLGRKCGGWVKLHNHFVIMIWEEGFGCGVGCGSEVNVCSVVCSCLLSLSLSHSQVGSSLRQPILNFSHHFHLFQQLGKRPTDFHVMPEIITLPNCYRRVKSKTKPGYQASWLMPPPAVPSDEKQGIYMALCQTRSPRTWC